VVARVESRSKTRLLRGVEQPGRKAKVKPRGRDARGHTTTTFLIYPSLLFYSLRQ
jgi:hypothetical protein